MGCQTSTKPHTASHANVDRIGSCQDLAMSCHHKRHVSKIRAAPRPAPLRSSTLRSGAHSIGQLTRVPRYLHGNSLLPAPETRPATYPPPFRCCLCGVVEQVLVTRKSRKRTDEQKQKIEPKTPVSRFLFGRRAPWGVTSRNPPYPSDPYTIPRSSLKCACDTTTAQRGKVDDTH